MLAFVILLFLPAGGEVVRMRAPHKKFLVKRGILLLWGGVRIERGKLLFLADAACVELDKTGSPRRLYAEGAVIVSDPKRFFCADAVWYDFQKETGVMRNAHAWLPFKIERLRLHISAETVRTEDRLKLVEAENAVASDCVFGKPHWGLRSRSMRVDQTQTLKARGNTIFIGPLPIPAPPLRIERDWWFPLRRLSFSHRTNFGQTSSVILRLWQAGVGLPHSKLLVEGRWETASLRGEGGGGFVRLNIRTKGASLNAQSTLFEFHDKGEIRGLWSGPKLRRYADIRATLSLKPSPNLCHLLMARFSSASDAQILPDFFPKKNREAEPQNTFFLSHIHNEKFFLRLFAEWGTVDFADVAVALPAFEAERFDILAKPLSVDVRVFAERRGWDYAVAGGVEDELGQAIGAGMRVRRGFWIGPLNIWGCGDGEAASYRELYGVWDETLGMYGSFEFGMGTLLWRRYGRRLHYVRPVVLWRRLWADRGAEAAFGFTSEWGAQSGNALITELRSGFSSLFSGWAGYEWDVERRMGGWRLHLEGDLRGVGVALQGGYELQESRGWRKGWLRYGTGKYVRVGWSEFAGKRLLETQGGFDVDGRWVMTVKWQYDLAEDGTSRVGFVVRRVFHCFFVEISLEWDRMGKERGISVRMGPVSAARRTKALRIEQKTE